MADEEDQLPVVLILAAPAWHPREPDSVLDDVEDLAIAQVLRVSGPHIGRGRIHILADLGFAAAVIGVADSAVIGEMVAPFGDGERRGLDGGAEAPGAGRSR